MQFFDMPNWFAVSLVFSSDVMMLMPRMWQLGAMMSLRKPYSKDSMWT